MTDSLDGNQTNDQVQSLDPPLTSSQAKEVSKTPDVTQHKTGLFVDVLNKKSYVIQGKTVQLPDAGDPEKYERKEQTFNTLLNELKGKLIKSKENEEEVHPPNISVRVMTTEKAIVACHKESFSPIALNFANENHAGGGPGFYKKPDGNFKYEQPSAKAQEECLCQRSNLMVSLTTLVSHKNIEQRGKDKMTRSYYDKPFTSTKECYISENHLFAIGGDSFYESKYLEEPVKVTFITSAAKYYGKETEANCTEKEEDYNDAKARIETHLLAAAKAAVDKKTKNPNEKVSLVLGAFGCGEFAPKNGVEYRRMIAGIYKEMLPQFQGFFDKVIFPIPTENDANFTPFSKVLSPQ